MFAINAPFSKVVIARPLQLRHRPNWPNRYSGIITNVCV